MHLEDNNNQIKRPRKGYLLPNDMHWSLQMVPNSKGANMRLEDNHIQIIRPRKGYLPSGSGMPWSSFGSCRRGGQLAWEKTCVLMTITIKQPRKGYLSSGMPWSSFRSCRQCRLAWEQTMCLQDNYNQIKWQRKGYLPSGIPRSSVGSCKQCRLAREKSMRLGVQFQSNDLGRVTYLVACLGQAWR